MSTEPTKAGGHKTLAVKLNPGLHAQLELVSKLDDIPMTTALVRAVEVYVKTRRSQPDFMERAKAAVAEAEAEAAARRSAIQALLGQAQPVPTAGSGAESVPSGQTDSSGLAGTEPAQAKAMGGKRGRSGEGASA